MSWFRFRPAVSGELARCADLVRAQDGADAVLTLEGLSALAQRRQLVHYVFIEQRADGQARIWGAGFTVLVGGDVARRAMAGEVAGLVAWLCHPSAASRGDVLGPAAQAAARRARDLHAVVLGFAIDPDPDCPVSQIQSVAQHAFLHAHSGYGLSSLIGEVDDARPTAEAYRASLAAMGCAPAPRVHGARTQVYFLTAGQMAQRPFHVLQPVFQEAAPVLRLSPAQRLQTELALLGYGDEDIARLMDVSADTVTKRWAHVYRAVDEHMPGVLWPPSSRSIRGPAKRRPLLNYLGTHLHELRP